MAKAKTGQLTPQAAPQQRGSLAFRNTRHGVVFQKWPRGRGRAVSPYRWYVEQEFIIASVWAGQPSPLDLETAKGLTAGSLLVWRDALVSASYGRFLIIIGEDGKPMRNVRDVSQNPQLILDLVTDEPGSILWRRGDGWQGAVPNAVGDVVTMTEDGVGWAPGNALNRMPLDTPVLTWAFDSTLPAQLVLTSSDTITLSTDIDGQMIVERDALTGDVTAPHNSNVTTIADGAVTYEKMQDVSSDFTVLGRSSAGAGQVEEVTAGTLASWLGGGGAGAWQLPYFNDATVYLTNPLIGNSTLSNVNATANAIVFMPIVVPWTRTFTKIAIQITSFIAGSNVRLGLFNLNSTTGGPGTVLVDGGNVATTSNGTKTVTINTTINPGIYFLASWWSHAVGVRHATGGSMIAGNGCSLGAATPVPITLLARNQTFGSAFSDESAQTHAILGGTALGVLCGIR